jgi:multiple sugar transport system ATP-binding protein
MEEATVTADSIVFKNGDKIPLPEQFRGQVRDGDKVVFGLRPDDIFPTGHGLSSGLDSAVHEVTIPVSITEPLGNETLVFVEFAGREWVSRMLNPRALKSGEQLKMSFDLSQAHLFSAETGKTLAVETAAI